MIVSACGLVNGWRFVDKFDDGETAIVPWYEIDGIDCTLTLEARPAHCDRGNWYAKISPRLGTALARDLDEQDGWPRYYFDRDRAMRELEAWLVKRGQWKGVTAAEVDSDFIYKAMLDWPGYVYTLANKSLPLLEAEAERLSDRVRAEEGLTPTVSIHRIETRVVRIR